jgi:hypothetical protein
MRRLAKAATTLVFAGTAAFAAATPASANGPLVNVVVTDLLNGNTVIVNPNVAIPVAAAICGVNANVLSSQLNKNGKANCPALTNVTQTAKVVNA